LLRRADVYIPVATAETASSKDDAVSESVFAFDSLSRVASESQSIAEGTAKVVNYDYDS